MGGDEPIVTLVLSLSLSSLSIVLEVERGIIQLFIYRWSSLFAAGKSNQIGLN